METSIKNADKIRQFQIEAIEWIEEKDGTGLLCFPMGSGKCLISLAYAIKNNLKTLIVCPNSIKFVWLDEIEKWSDKNSTMLSAKDKELDFSKDFTIINYDIVKKFLPQLKKQKFDFIILDESHFIKSTKAQRSKAVKKLNIPRRLLLTGTPITNKPLDIWNQLNYINKRTWNNWLTFRDTYIKGYYHPHFTYFIETGTKNIEELSKKIKPFVFRKRKEEILSELPPKIYNKMTLSIDGEHLKKYDLAIDNFRKFLLQYTELNQSEINRRLRGEAFSKVQTLKQICTRHRVETKIIKSLSENILENNPDDKIVIFSQYRGVVKDLHEQIPNSVMVHGEMDILARNTAVNEFQNHEEVKVFIGTVQTSGVGITLTKSSNVIFADLMWSPSDQEQAIDRCHRIGTVKAVNIFYVLSKGTIDETIYNLLQNKQATIDQIIDGQEFKKPTNVYDEFLKGELRKLHE